MTQYPPGYPIGTGTGTGTGAGLDASAQPRPTGLFAGWQPRPTGLFAGWQPRPTGLFAGWQPQPTGLFAGWQPQPTGLHTAWQPQPTGQRGTGSASPEFGVDHPVFGVDPATASPWPWRELHPGWTYEGGGHALLSQALRKVRTRLIGERDVRLVKGLPGQVTAQKALDAGLWRWGSEFRREAVMAELLARTVVKGRSVYAVLHSNATAGAPVRLHKVFELLPHGLPGAPFDYAKQIDKVMRAAVEREERLPEILSQTEDFRIFFYALGGLDSVATPRLDELILLAWAWATPVVMALKNNVAEYRPVQRSSLLMPVIATPQHGSLPSGHATVATMTAHLLAVLLYQPQDPRAQVLQRLASRIAFNRVVAGVHFPMDSYVGRYLGVQLASLFRGMAQEQAPLPRSVQLRLRPNSEWTENDLEYPLLKGHVVTNAPAVAPLGAMWRAAVEELNLRGFGPPSRI